MILSPLLDEMMDLYDAPRELTAAKTAPLRDDPARYG
jgi:hypothetical protein